MYRIVNRIDTTTMRRIGDSVVNDDRALNADEIDTAVPDDIILPKWDSNNKVWVSSLTDAEVLEAHKGAKIRELRDSCDKSIKDGFVSTVLDANGVAYQFFYDDVAQMKLNGQTNKVNIYMNQLSLGKITQADYDAKFPIPWNTKSHGWVNLTEAQYMTITNDAESHERTNLQKRTKLISDVNACTTKTEIDAIVW